MPQDSLFGGIPEVRLLRAMGGIGALTAALLLTGCAVLPDVITFATATEKMTAETDQAFVGAREVFADGMVATLEPGERAAVGTPLSKVPGKRLMTDCECVKKVTENSKLKDCLASPDYRSDTDNNESFTADQYQVLGGLVCMELAHRQIRLFQGSAASYSGSLKKLIDAGNGGKKAADSLVSSVNNIAGVMGASGLITEQVGEVFAAFYGELAKHRAHRKLEQVLPATDLAVAELEKLLKEALEHLESGFDAGALALRTELDADEYRWLVATKRDIDQYEAAAVNFLVHSLLGPQPPGATPKFLEALQNLDNVLEQLQPSVVFECHPTMTLDKVVCDPDAAQADYNESGKCDDEEIGDDELMTACCKQGEECCAEGECKSVSTLLAERTKHWEGRLKELAKVKAKFPQAKFKDYSERKKASSASELNARASLAAARLSIESWAASHRVMAGSVIKTKNPGPVGGNGND